MFLPFVNGNHSPLCERYDLGKTESDRTLQMQLQGGSGGKAFLWPVSIIAAGNEFDWELILRLIISDY